MAFFWGLSSLLISTFASDQVGLQIAGRLSVRPGQAKVRPTWAFQARLWRGLPASWGLAAPVGFWYIPYDRSLFY